MRKPRPIFLVQGRRTTNARWGVIDWLADQCQFKFSLPRAWTYFLCISQLFQFCEELDVIKSVLFYKGKTPNLLDIEYAFKVQQCFLIPKRKEYLLIVIFLILKSYLVRLAFWCRTILQQPPIYTLTAEHLKYASSKLSLLAVCFSGFLIQCILPDRMIYVILVPVLKTKLVVFLVRTIIDQLHWPLYFLKYWRNYYCLG